MTGSTQKRTSWLNSKNLHVVFNLRNLHIAFKIASVVLLGIYLNGIVQTDKNGHGKLKNITPPDLGLVAIVLIYSSDALNRLRELKVGSNELELTFDQKKLEANKDANQKEASALVLLGEQIFDPTIRKEFFSKLLYDGEKELLERIDSSKKQGKSYLYDASSSFQVEQKLLHLSALNFIQIRKETGYSFIGSLKGGEDLTEIFEITEEGKKCLAILAEEIIPSNNGNVPTLIQNQQN